MRSVPPYALDAPEFRFRGLATLMGHAALGGARELVLGTLLGARLVDGVVGAHPLPLSLRRTRAAAAKTWLSAVALPAAARAPIGRLIEATASDDRRALGDAWDAVSTLVAPTLDLPARTELRRLSAVLATEAA